MNKIVIARYLDYFQNMGFRIEKTDFSRPWGGFFVIDASQSEFFVTSFFQDIPSTKKIKTGLISPKILFVKPGERLSWQFHLRRSELWKVIQGSVGVVRSSDDQEGPQITVEEGEVVELQCGERHRLVGLEDWGIIAEIWIHNSVEHPSDENDIVRVQDDYSR